MARDVTIGLKPELYRLYSKPIHLVELYLNSPYITPSHRYCANNQDITFAGNVYTAIAAKRGSIKSEEATVLQDLEISLDNIDLEFKQSISGGLLKDKRITIFVVFQGFLNDYANKIILFDGIIDNSYGDNRFLNMTISAKFLFDREFPRRTFQTGCNWTFGDENCTKSLSSYQNNLIVKTDSTESVLLFNDTGLVEDYFFPGYVKITSGDMINQVRPILASNAISITLRIPFSDIPDVGVTFQAQKLCSRNPTACKDIFNNYTMSYGGFPHTPREPKL